MSETIYLHIHSRDTGTSQLLSFNHSPVSVGRNLCNDVVLTSPYVSHLHGILQFSASHIDYVDLGSANGSILCGQKIAPREVQEILPSSELRLGPVSIRIDRELKAGEILTTTQVAQLHSFERELDEVLSPSPSKREPTQVWSCEPQQSEPESVLTTVWQRPTEASSTPTTEPESPPDIDQIVEKMQPLYRDYVSACGKLLESLRANTKTTSRHQRNQLLEKLQIQYPEVLREPAIREYFRTEKPSHEATASRALQWLARELSGQLQAPTSAKDISSFVTRLVAVAQAQARALVGLHSGALEFAREHAHLVPFDANDPLANPDSPKKVLHFLYDWRTPTAPKLRALNQAYKVLMAHQLGLIGGLRGSVRSLLKHLGPAAIEAN
ncbi:MAG: FHA domain-containing protein, partial [Nannocystaceae bacterium]